MAIFKCKMCGGDLEIFEGTTVAECDYCGTKQTVPTADDEKKLSMFTRANRLRFACEFDKAAGVYESIVVDFPDEAEAYWGLILCKYGIEYVDDPTTTKKIPTCHRSSFDPVLDDSNFDLVMENSNTTSRIIYREEAKQIEELRKGIIEVSSKEKPYDIFICYKETDQNGDRTIDSVIAQDVYSELVAKGYRVFFSRITLEDKLGQEYEPYIFSALNSAKIMLAFGTDYEYYNAVWVKNEWSRFLQLIAKGEKKTLIPCYKGIDAYDMPKEFAKLQAQDMGKVGAIQDLLRGIEKILPKEDKNATSATAQHATNNPTINTLLERVFIFLEDREWDDATEYCEKALDLEPQNALAYAGKLCAEYKVASIEALCGADEDFVNSTNYKRAMQYASEDLKTQFSKILDDKELAKTIKIYNEACALMAENTITSRTKAIELFKTIADYGDVAQKLELCNEEKVELAKRREEMMRINKIASRLIATDKSSVIGLKPDGRADVVIVGSRPKTDPNLWTNLVSITRACGLRSNGTVVAIEGAIDTKYDVSNWKNIVAISKGDYHIIGLKSDGTVVATGNNSYGECNVSRWKDINTIVAGRYHSSVGFKSNGTVIATGHNSYGQCNISNWENIIAISSGTGYTVGLKVDGTVVSAGRNADGRCSVSDWEDIISISASIDFTVGLKSDGTVVATGSNDGGQCNVSDWKDIIAISTGSNHTVGLKTDGTVVATGEIFSKTCSTWRDIIAISSYGWFTIGLKSDGTVVSAGLAADVSSMKLFNSVETLEQEYEEGKQKMLQLIAERKQKGICQYCGGTFKSGLFSTKCSRCGNPKHY